MNKRKLPRINYIGNKEKIADWIIENFPSNITSVFDAFSWGISVSYKAKQKWYKVISNDILSVNYQLSKALIENSKIILLPEDLDIIFSWKPKKGFIYKNYSEVFFFPEECQELDQYKENIESGLKCIYKKALAYSLLRRAMIRKMPYSRFCIPWEKIVQLRDEEYSYSKYKRRRWYHNESFKKHFLDNIEDYNNAVFDNNQENIALNKDIFEVLPVIQSDLIYLDPPYTWTMNNYFGFYGFFDELIEWKRKKPFSNNFVDKKSSITLFDELFSHLGNFKYWVLSYNNSSYPSKEQLIEVISKYSTEIKILEKSHNYQVTGKDAKWENTEYLFIIKNPLFF